MIASIVLTVVLLGTAAALTRRRRALSSGRSATGADRKALKTVALGLRTVAEGRAHSPHPMPEVHAVVYSHQQLTLRLIEADALAPAPWTADVSGKEWSVEPANLRRAGNRDTGRTHPYSLTVTLGRHRDDRVLVDLSQMSGTIALTGDDNDVLRLGQALITELVSGPVGLLATVVLVGTAASPPVTDGLGARSSRLHTAATRGEAMTCGPTEPSGSVASASAYRTPHIRHDRATAATRSHSRRLFVVTAAQFRNERWQDAPLRGTDTILVLGYIPNADWQLQINADGSLDTGRLGLPIDAHTAWLP